MDITFFLSALSFALALATVLISPRARRLRLLWFIVTMILVVTCGAQALLAGLHRRRVSSVQSQILNLVREGRRVTFEDIYLGLYKPDYRVVTEAVDTLIDAKRLNSELMQFRFTDDTFHAVSMYTSKKISKSVIKTGRSTWASGPRGG
jgi:hypothetical protein